MLKLRFNQKLLGKKYKKKGKVVFYIFIQGFRVARENGILIDKILVPNLTRNSLLKGTKTSSDDEHF